MDTEGVITLHRSSRPGKSHGVDMWKMFSIQLCIGVYISAISDA